MNCYQTNSKKHKPFLEKRGIDPYSKRRSFANDMIEALPLMTPQPQCKTQKMIATVTEILQHARSSLAGRTSSFVLGQNEYVIKILVYKS